MEKYYWKDGFHDTPVKGSVEISEEYWRELLDGQAAGLCIVEASPGMPVLQEPAGPTLEEVKAAKIANLRAYDTSEAVNGFSLNGVTAWLDKSTRSGLLSTIEVQQRMGVESTTLWCGTGNPVPIEIRISDLLELVCSVELYAKSVYDTTQNHIRIINGLYTIKQVTEYDFTKGYPEKLSFDFI